MRRLLHGLCLAVACALPTTGAGSFQQEPLTLVLLLDASAGTRNAMAPFIWDGSPGRDGLIVGPNGKRSPDSPIDLFMTPILDGLVPSLSPGDRVRIASVASEIRWSNGFTADRSTIAASAKDVLRLPEHDRYGATPLWDGVDESLSALTKENGRRVVLLVTAGMSSGNRIGLDAVARRAESNRIPVSAIYEGSYGLRGPGFRFTDATSNPWAILTSPFGSAPHMTLKRLALQTGGTYLEDGVDAPSDLKSRLRTALTQFRSLR